MALDTLVVARQTDPEWPLRLAKDYLRGLGLTLLACAWARSAQVALPHQETDVWYADKVKTALLSVQWLLPEADWR